ncbi:MAG: PEGA domain-containing protein [Clostridia bacterium]|nr:PEGA domain-containing protein [Clostridia bacterium]
MLKTNASGQAVFNLRTGSYNVQVKAKGYKTLTDSVTVASAAVTKAIVLTANS